MKNSDKIQILKENIVNYIKNTKDADENLVFNFAKIQAKEMKIEITKGEIKSIVINILNSINNSTKKDYDYEYLDCKMFDLEHFSFYHDFDI